MLILYSPVWVSEEDHFAPEIYQDSSPFWLAVVKKGSRMDQTSLTPGKDQWSAQYIQQNICIISSNIKYIICCLILIMMNHEHAKERKKYFVTKCF